MKVTILMRQMPSCWLALVAIIAIVQFYSIKCFPAAESPKSSVTNQQSEDEHRSSFYSQIEPFYVRNSRMLADVTPGNGETQADNEGENVDEDLKSDEEQDEPTEETERADDTISKGDVDLGDEVKSQVDHKLLVILVDGFRYDYVQRDPTLKGLPRMAKQGVYAKQVRPAHPSKSYTNYYSILTGLYAESHGFVDNFIRDKFSGDLFLGSPHPNASHSHWWSQAEPLWITAEKHKIKTAVYGWDGCQVRTTQSNNKKWPPTTVCEPYERYPGAKKEKERLRQWLDRIVQDFKEHKHRLAMVYYETIDHTGHKYSPQSRITKQAVRDLDEIIYDLQDLLTKTDLNDEVNVYVLSDHGMISTKKFKTIKLNDLIDMNDVELVLGMGSTMQLLAEKGKHSQVFKKLRQANVKGLNVYEKTTIPERFHIRGHRNLLPIYLTADKGYQIVPPAINAKVFPDRDLDDDGVVEMPKGDHGYDVVYVDEMKTIMYAYGPDIRVGETIEHMEQVDHYNIFCQLLSIEPRPNNGTDKLFGKILTKFQEEDSSAEKDEEDDEKGEIKANGDDDDDNGSVRLYAGFHRTQIGLFGFLVVVWTLLL